LPGCKILSSNHRMGIRQKSLSNSRSYDQSQLFHKAYKQKLLPCCEHIDQQTAKRMNSEPTTKSLVLYVDDDKDDIELVREAFERYPDIELLTFSESYAFLRYVINGKSSPRIPSLILIDINMPVLNGKELLTMLRSYPHLRNVMIVMYTTSNFHADKDFAKRLNARFVTKPVERQELHTIIDELLNKCGLL
jgi:CheY-like chemotaxis protein